MSPLLATTSPTAYWYLARGTGVVAMLLLTFPELKTEDGPVADRLRAHGAAADVLASWKELVAQEILPEGSRLLLLSADVGG